MHPTIDEQLEGIARLVERATDRYPEDPSLAPLRTAAGTLRRIAASWSEILPYLTRDNRNLQDLFERFATELPDAVRAELRALEGRAIDPLSARAVEQHNRALRGALARWVRALPSDAAERRAALTHYFRDRIAHDPSSRRARSGPNTPETTR